MPAKGFALGKVVRGQGRSYGFVMPLAVRNISLNISQNISDRSTQMIFIKVLQQLDFMVICA